MTKLGNSKLKGKKVEKGKVKGKGYDEDVGMQKLKYEKRFSREVLYVYNVGFRVYLFKLGALRDTGVKKDSKFYFPFSEAVLDADIKMYKNSYGSKEEYQKLIEYYSTWVSLYLPKELSKNSAAHPAWIDILEFWEQGTVDRMVI